MMDVRGDFERQFAEHVAEGVAALLPSVFGFRIDHSQSFCRERKQIFSCKGTKCHLNRNDSSGWSGRRVLERTHSFGQRWHPKTNGRNDWK